jgi:hypothetical protein
MKEKKVEVLDINVGNQFSKEVFESQVVPALEAGKVIALFVNCIGHTRAEMTHYAFSNAIEQRFGKSVVYNGVRYPFPTYNLTKS